MAIKTKVETQTLKLKVPLEKLKKIDAARVVARYTTRTDYMIDSALQCSPVYLNEIARHIGQLGLICNSVLIPDEDRPEQGILQGSDARRVVRRIIKTCDAITAALRG